MAVGDVVVCLVVLLIIADAHGGVLVFKSVRANDDGGTQHTDTQVRKLAEIRLFLVYLCVCW